MESLTAAFTSARTAATDVATAHPIWASVVLAATVASLGRLVAGGRKKGPKKHAPRLRSSSFGTTKLLVSGTPDPETVFSLIQICVELSPMPDTDTLVARFSEHVLPYQRFHCVPHQTQDCGEVTWVPVKVDTRAHFITHDVPTAAHARSVIDGFVNAKLKASMQTAPWWEVHLLRRRDGSNAGTMVIRVHHALGDGVSLMEAFSPMLTDAKNVPLDLSKSFSPGGRGPRKHGWNPIRFLANAFGAVGNGLKVAGYAAIGGDTPSAFNSKERCWPYRGDKIVVYMPSHKLDVIKAIKNAAGKGTTVNDVEFALYGGTIRRFVQKFDPKAPDMNKAQMRALTPLAVLEKADPVTKYATLLRNGWTFIVNKMPVSQKTALERLRASHKSWAAIKSSTVVPAAFFMHMLAAKLPLAMQRQTQIDLSSKMSTVFSNVPGPQEPSYVAGGRITAVHMVFPNLNPQVGILSFDGTVHMCVTMSPDPNGVDLRTEFPKCFTEELNELAGALGVDASSAFSV